MLDDWFCWVIDYGEHVCWYNMGMGMSMSYNYDMIWSNIV